MLSERDMRPEHVIAGDSRLQSEVLEDLESAVNYRRWLCSLAYPYLGVNPIEIGSGLGHYASEWADAGFKLTASEADNARLKVLQDRFAHSDRVTVRHLAVPIDASPKYTAVVAYNVLEHIEDDVEALKSFAGLLQPYGAVILIVPAFPAALGDFDRAVGHFRRYRKRDLEAKLTAAGLAVKLTHYMNAPGLLIWYVAVRLLRQLPKRGVGLCIYDRLLVPMTWRVERRIRPPFGQSLFAVALRVDPRPPGSELRLQT